jgi:outer membrane protein assembly factor BamE (lipoprotein component of BamABCDE complex)
MKSKIRLSALLFFLALTSCAMFSKAREENLHDIHNGMTKSEVIEVLGKPDKEGMEGTNEKWQYLITSSDLKHEYPYTATFSNGVLSDFYLNAAHNESKPQPEQKSGGGKKHGGTGGIGG